MNQDIKEIARIAAQALNEKKAEDVKVLDISKVSDIGDAFVIANGTNPNQVSALVDAVEEELGKKGYHPKQREGKRNGSWVLLDYEDVIIHIFDGESRAFYHLERIWKDGKDITEDLWNIC